MSKQKEQWYIRKRKLIAFGNSLCFYLCSIFPIKRMRIAICTFEGKSGFGCNPKYIVEELHRRNSEYEFVWLVNDMNKKFPDYIKKVPNSLWSRAYWLSTSKIWIDNYRKPFGIRKRKGQFYLNVNHYTIAIKSTGLWRGKSFSQMAYLVSKNDSDMIDALVIDSKWCEEMMPKGMLYKGDYLKTGAPRCDVLYGDRKKKRHAFRKRHQIPDEAKVLMFAPTFREGAKAGKRNIFSEIWTIDFKRLIHNLEGKFGGNWYLCVRVHPQLSPSCTEYHNSDIKDRLIDESQADDMYEILSAMDAYITDYSSAIFEAGFAAIPAFIYADDIQTYAVDRGSLMWSFMTDELNCVKNNKAMTPGIDTVLPFSVAVNNKELEKNIMEFDEEEYGRRLDKFHKDIGLVFDGKASSRIADKIEEHTRF